MKIEEIKELVTLLEGSVLNVLEISEGESRIRLEKAAVMPASMPMPQIQMVSPGGQQLYSGDAPANNGEMPEQAKKSVGKAVKSPMVGVFYSAAAPGEEDFVAVGSRVEKGDVICIVEAMKLMNEITAEEKGEIVEICVKSGDVVEFGQPLFYIK